MELIGSIFRKFRRGESQTVKPEKSDLPRNWDYSHFREYLLALTRGKNFLLPVGQYPDSIQLNGGWDEALKKMRKDTIDGYERWALVGFKEDRRSLYLPTIAARGLPDHVPGKLQMEEIDKARVKAGIIGFVGDIHSHPKDLVEEIWFRAFTDLDELVGWDLDRAIFSAGDLYRIVVPDSDILMMGLVEGQENLFAFRTRESTDLGVSRDALPQEAFEKYWYERNGFRYLGSVKEYGAKRVQAITPTADRWVVNTEIAERHKLVLYRGSSGTNLTKVFTSSQ